MILQKLPPAGSSTHRDTPPFFPDHCLFTEHLVGSYHYPDHAAAFGIVTTLKGNSNLVLHGEDKAINEVSFLLVNYGSRFAVDDIAPGTQPAFLFFDSQLTSAARHTDFSYSERVHAKRSSLHDKLLLLAQTGNSCSSFASLKADMIIRTILEELVARNQAAMQAASRLSVTKRSTRLELFKRLAYTKEWLEDNYARPVTLHDMANIAMMNHQHFLRKFRECYTVTPHQYLTGIRLQNAKNMLAGTNKPVSTICQHCGFESLSSFSWLFRQQFGISPSQFRQSAR
jgi:AraC family transcriptional regulator